MDGAIGATVLVGGLLMAALSTAATGCLSVIALCEGLILVGIGLWLLTAWAGKGE